MWWTPLGQRVLRGAQNGNSSATDSPVLCDMVQESKSSDDPELCFVGVKAFDQLQPNQKLALLALVSKALKDQDEPMPELTAHTEADRRRGLCLHFRDDRDGDGLPPASEKVDGWDDPLGRRSSGHRRRVCLEAPCGAGRLPRGRRASRRRPERRSSRAMIASGKQQRRRRPHGRHPTFPRTRSLTDPTDEQLESVRRTLRDICGG